MKSLSASKTIWKEENKMYKMNQSVKLEEPKQEDFLLKVENLIRHNKEKYNANPAEILLTLSARKLFNGVPVKELFGIPVKYFKSTSYPQDRIIVYVIAVSNGSLFINSAVFLL